MVLILNNQDLESVLDLPACIDALDRGLKAYIRGDAARRPRIDKEIGTDRLKFVILLLSVLIIFGIFSPGPCLPPKSPRKLCAGEFAAAVELIDYRAAEFKHKGCPIEMTFSDPTIGALVLLYAARHSPHPYAAALLVDYMLSETGQRTLAEKGRYTGRPGMRVKYPEMDITDRKINLLFLRPEDEEELGKKYLKLRERFLPRR